MRIASNLVYINEQFIPATIAFEKGKITAIETGIHPSDHFYHNLKIVPGFVDIHCHGYHGYNCNQADREGLKSWLKALIKEGCTSILASSSSAAEDELLASFKIIDQVMKERPQGAEILGIYVEGPYISFKKAGVQNPYTIRKPDAKEIELWQQKAHGNIRLCCIAPEMDENHEMIKACTSLGIRVALGHTTASYEEAISAVKDGAVDFTHTFNAMTQLEHRQPGTVGAAMLCEQAYAELISDGVHVHDAACHILAKCKGKDKLILVTDSSQFKGYQPGIYEEAHRQIAVREDGSIRKLDGTLAGSSNAMNQLVKHAIFEMGIDEVTVLNAATKNPCEMLGIECKGKLDVGRDADILIVDDEYQVIQVYCRGIAQL